MVWSCALGNRLIGRTDTNEEDAADTDGRRCFREQRARR